MGETETDNFCLHCDEYEVVLCGDVIAVLLLNMASMAVREDESYFHCWIQ